MRDVADAARVRAFLHELGHSGVRARLYLVGGATAVSYGWRASTTDIDVLLEPEDDRLLKAIQRLKETLRVNVELAAPLHFIPEVHGWRERSIFVDRFGGLDVFHFDPVSQALAKIERGHALDVVDVREMLGRGLVTAEQLRDAFAEIEPELFRFPAIDPPAFRRALEEALGA